MAKGNERRPQAPKRRNPVKKHMDTFSRPETHRDRTKYDRYEDYLDDQLDDYLDDYDDEDFQIERENKKKFKAKLAGEDYDPDEYKNYEEWKDQQNFDQKFNEAIDQIAKEIKESMDKELLDQIAKDTPKE